MVWSRLAWSLLEGCQAGRQELASANTYAFSPLDIRPYYECPEIVHVCYYLNYEFLGLKILLSSVQFLFSLSEIELILCLLTAALHLNLSVSLSLSVCLLGVDAPGTAGPSLRVREGRGCSHLGHSTPLKLGSWSLLEH